jgi:hypothetical protein
VLLHAKLTAVEHFPESISLEVQVPFKTKSKRRMTMRYAFAPFVTIGIVFIILGINGQRTFIPIGIVFIVLGLVMAIKAKRR